MSVRAGPLTRLNVFLCRMIDPSSSEEEEEEEEEQERPMAATAASALEVTPNTNSLSRGARSVGGDSQRSGGAVVGHNSSVYFTIYSHAYTDTNSRYRSIGSFVVR